MWPALTILGLMVMMSIGSLPAHSEVSIQRQEIDVVWSKSDGIRPEIFYTTFTGSDWSEPVMVTDDYFDNMHPVIDRDSSGTRWLFWSAYDSGKSEIRYTKGNDDDWETPRALAAELVSNNGPSVVIADNDEVWIVWSGSDGGLDDIYYAVNRNGTWTETERLHDANEVPDTLPVIGLDDEGRIWVSWKQYRGAGYAEVMSVYDETQWSNPEVIDPEKGENESEDEIVLPDFVEQGGMIFTRLYE